MYKQTPPYKKQKTYKGFLHTHNPNNLNIICLIFIFKKK
ncbi:hypothetical protein BE24_0037 [Staphylococcus phage vB_SepM_BE24]|nr:hypothetical protein BE24_0037 [Staphylococcus phage vB_SepM_BE24]